MALRKMGVAKFIKNQMTNEEIMKTSQFYALYSVPNIANKEQSLACKNGVIPFANLKDKTRLKC